MKKSKCYLIKSKELIYRKNDRVNPYWVYIFLSVLNKIPTRLITRLSRVLASLLRPLHFKCRFRVLNKELLFYLHSNFYEFVYHGGMVHELRISENLLRLVPNNSVFYDVGCAVGWYSILLVDKCQKVIGFDPYDLSSLLNVQLNGINNFEFYPYFLSDRQETGDIKITTLDTLIGQNFPLPDVIKIDVEGEEYKVLLGANNLFNTKPPKIVLIETHSEKLFYDCLEFLKSFDYRIYNLGCPKVNIGGDIYPLDHILPTDTFNIKCPTRILLGLKNLYGAGNFKNM